MAEQKKKDERKRNYATLVYPDSAPENWQEILSELKIPVFISPLHDKDVNADGKPKKPHYHVQFIFDGKKSDDQFKEIIAKFGGVGVEDVQSLRGYARYLCHLDNPDKAQYNTSMVKALGGADYFSVIGRMTDKAQACREMQTYINENDIICFADLADYAAANNSQWYDCLLNSGAYYIKEYIKSRTWKLYKVREQ